MKINGTMSALTELGLFFISSYFIRQHNDLSYIHPVAYYWFMFTIMTGIWEFTYVTHKQTVSQKARELINTDQRVWTSDYSVCVLLPWNFSKIFYAEYAAYADREYMVSTDRWSLVIEGSHATCCAVFSIMAICFYIHDATMLRFYISMGAAMGSQLMNSLLYMSEYVIQTHDSDNENYNSDDFPCGFLLSKRPFMYINILWTFMPGGILIGYLM